MFFGDLTYLDPIVNALGWALTHFVWQGLLIGVVFWLGNRALRTASPGLRYAFGLVCMVLLLAAPVFTAFITYQQPAEGLAQASGIISSFNSVSSVASGETVETASSLEAWADRAMPFVVMGWVLGVLFMSLRVGWDWYRMLRLTKVGVRALNERLQAKADELIELFGIHRAVQVLESAIVQVPTVMGWFKPVILLPSSSLTGLTPAQLELVIAHELGHIRRFDYAVNLLQVFIETLLFYHPVVRWISQHVRNEREKCCDDLVVTRCGNRLEYAKALSNLATIRNGDLSPALGATDGQLVQRIERIVCQHVRRQGADHSNLLVVATLAVAVFLAGRATDPMAQLELERAALGEQLVTELLLNRVPAQTEALIAPWEEATKFFVEEEPAQAPVVERATQQNAAVSSIPVENNRAVTEATTQVAVADTTTPVLAQPEVAEVNVAAELSRIAANLEMPAAVSAEDEIVLPLGAEPAAEAGQSTNNSVIAFVAEPSAEQFAPVETVLEPTAPVVVRRVLPEYPSRARTSGRSGFVTVEFGVSPSGRPVDIRILDSEPGRLFNREAKRALRAWRFDPVSSSQFIGQRFTQNFTFEFGTSKAVGSQSYEDSCSLKTGSRICKKTPPSGLRQTRLQAGQVELVPHYGGSGLTRNQ